MSLFAARAGETFFVQIKPQKPGNNTLNSSITAELTRLGICEENTQEESRTEEHLKKFYEVHPSFVSALLRNLKEFSPHFTIYHSFHGDKKTKYEPNKGNALGTKTKKKRVVRKSATRL